MVGAGGVEMWTKGGKVSWKRWRHPGPGLDALSGGRDGISQILLIGSDPEDDERMLALIRLIRRLEPWPVIVIAGQVHPSAPWRESVLRAGADRAILVSARVRPWGNPQPPLEDAVDLCDGICKELLAQCERRITLFVCGRTRYRWVLARHHLDRWCLSRKEECPHWSGGSRG